MRAPRSLVLPLSFMTCATSVAHAQVQNYPNQPIRTVVPYALGGFIDTIARLVGKKLQDFDAFFKSERARWARVIKEANITAG